MSNMASKQNRRESLISKIYSIYDAMSFIKKSHDVDVESRRVIVEALQNELVLTKDVLKKIEMLGDEESEDTNDYRQTYRIAYLC